MKRRLHLAGLAVLLIACTGISEAADPAAPQSAIEPARREGGHLKRFAEMNQQLDRGNVDLLFLGDSITAGWLGRGKETWEKYYAQRSAIDLGRSGERTQHVLWMMDNLHVDHIAPKLAVVLIGTNNVRANTAEEIAEGIARIVKRLRAKLPKTKILLMAIFPRGANGENPERRTVEKVNRAIAKLADGGGGHTLETFLVETALVSDTDGWETEVDRVTLMTLHASKGLEFPVVFLVAVEEGLLPHERSKENPNELEEERRLMFVGITRAQEELQISYAKYRDFRGQRKMPVPSCFLMELPRTEMEVQFADMPPAPFGSGTGIEGEEHAVHEEYEEPVYRRTDEEPRDGARFREGEGSLAPDDFSQGMKVEHPQYGIGEIAALSGAGAARQATIDFPAPAGRMKFLLAGCTLRPVQ